MQDNPAKRAPKVFRSRICVDCQQPYIPKSGRQVRCAPCKEGPPRAVCGADDCTAELRRDNEIGYCEAHKYATARAPVRYCGAEDCERTLRIDNTVGYCREHYSENEERQREYKDRANAKARERNAARPDLRPLCSVGDCPNRLRSDNATGRCPEHHYLPLDLPECPVDGCTNRMITTNKIGRCNEHRGQYWDPDAPKCGAEGCGQTLHADNKFGYCHAHRTMAPGFREQQRAYYLSRQAEMVEYARLYRTVYADEHRASARAHYAANGRITPEAQRAAAARRRQRAEHGMDALDRFLSAEYRKAIANDPCFYCGDPETHHVDHYFPLAKGGNDAWFNLVASCRVCNLSKFTACGTAFLLRFAA